MSAEPAQGSHAGTHQGSMRVAAVLAAAIACWSAISAQLADGDPWVMVRLFGLLVATWALGSWLSHPWPWLPAAVGGAAAILIWTFPVGGTYASGVPFGPLRYANATGVAAFLLVVLSLVGARGVRTPALRAAWLVGAGASTLVVLRSGSAAAVVLLGLLAVGLFVARLLGAKVLWWSCTGVLAAALIGTTLVGATYDPDGQARTHEGLLVEWLSPRRPELWHEAWGLMTEAPLVGVGPGNFQHESDVARRDVDVVAAHNLFLQVGSEEGVPGLLLLVLFTTWTLGCYRRRSDTKAVLGLLAFTGAVLHATIDYGVHAPAVVAALGLIIGTTTAPPSTRTPGD